MAFGQQAGPPASAKQVQYVLALLKRAGYDGFRDARHPLGLTQRQAAGKLTSREASELIERLLGNDGGEQDADGGSCAARVTADGTPDGTPDDPPDDPPDDTPDDTPDDPKAALLRSFPAHLLADELRRRGWDVSPPARPPAQPLPGAT